MSVKLLCGNVILASVVTFCSRNSKREKTVEQQRHFFLATD